MSLEAGCVLSSFASSLARCQERELLHVVAEDEEGVVAEAHALRLEYWDEEESGLH